MSSRNGVTAPKGFVAGGSWCGVKKKNDGTDLALIVSESMATTAGVFTNNQVKGAPVLWSKKQLRDSQAKAIVINSGNSNVMTVNGMADTESMADAVSNILGCPVGKVLVASTGVIGVPLPINKIVSGISALAPQISRRGGNAAAEAIMTTDTFSKESVATCLIGGKKVTVGGCAKGSGMIHPNMATMLSFITTDAAVEKSVLKKILKQAMDESFNRISVDGDGSTSDMVIVMANGEAGAGLIDKASGKRYDALLGAVVKVCVDLAKMIVKDGEGATKFVTVNVNGAKTEKDAHKVANAIATSSLVKTAMFGEDANWGRIMMAAGNAGVAFDADKTSLSISGANIIKNGALISSDWEKEVAPKLKKKEIFINLGLNSGNKSSIVWTCDFSYDYVKINADYRT